MAAKSAEAESPARAFSAARLALLGALFALAALLLYGPALHGQFFSDDQHYVWGNPYLHELSVENLIAIWDPTSVLAQIVENYAPVHLMLHSFEWQLFGREVLGYHVVNTLAHALAATLLALVFARSGISAAASVVAAALFLVHPANVEAVAWIAQLKTPVAMAAMLGALLLHPRRPALALLCFAVALLAKPTAAVALPVAVAWGWTRSAPGAADAPDWHWRWLVGWAAAFALFAVAEFAAFFDTAGQAPPIYSALDVRLRSVCGIALRYAVMAVTGGGLSVFHETPAARSWLDPWWLGSLVMMALIGWRMVAAARDRRRELVFWVWAVVSFGPISGIIPLPFPMADRYLYFILPGLLGAVLHLARDREAVRRRLAEPDRQGLGPFRVTPARTALVIAAVAATSGFGVATHGRAGIWVTPQRLMADAEEHYPDGAAAKTRQATRAASAGDIDTAVEKLRGAMARGYNRLDQLLQEPAYHPYHDHPGFRAILDDLARDFVERFEGRRDPSQVELRVLGQAYVVLGDLESAELALARALEHGGPFDVQTRADLEALRRQRRIEADAAKRRAARGGS